MAAEWITTSAAAERGTPVGVEPEPIGADVAGDHVDALGHLGEAVGTQLGAQPVEAVVAEQLAVDPSGGAGSSAVADEEVDPDVGHAAQETLDQSGPDEPGGPGDEDRAFRREPR